MAILTQRAKYRQRMLLETEWQKQEEKKPIILSEYVLFLEELGDFLKIPHFSLYFVSDMECITILFESLGIPISLPLGGHMKHKTEKEISVRELKNSKLLVDIIRKMWKAEPVSYRSVFDSGVLNRIMYFIARKSKTQPRGGTAELRAPYSAFLEKVDDAIPRSALLLPSQLLLEGKSTCPGDGTAGDDTQALYWAKGTGFGYGDLAAEWDEEASFYRQMKKEKTIKLLLRLVAVFITGYDSLRKGRYGPVEKLSSTAERETPRFGSPGGRKKLMKLPDGHPNQGRNTPDTPPAKKRKSGREGRLGELGEETLERELLQSKHDGATPPSHRVAEVLYTTFERSCIVPLLEGYMRNDSLLDMTRIEQNSGVHAAVFELIDRMSRHAPLVHLLDNLENQSISIVDLLKNMAKQAAAFLLRASKATKSQETQTGQSVISKPETKLALKIAGLSAVVRGRVNRYRQAQQQKKGKEEKGLEEEEEEMSSGSAEQVEARDDQIVALYVKELAPLQFDSSSFVDDNGRMNHHYREENDKNEIRQSSKLMRIAQEVGTLATSLPLSFESAIFVRADDDNIQLLKAMITGPPNTPYGSGCFLFDIFFPYDYPRSPPSVHFVTTGHGTVRMNPNLYSCGKVCLSLLGTWSGSSNEMWKPNRSTVLSVLVSIVAMILVADPYFNEPGYEVWRGTSTGDERSRQYNNAIRLATVKYGMLAHLRETDTDPVFREAIRKHFYYKREEVRRQVSEWKEDTKKNAQQYARMSKLAEELDKMLLVLEREMAEQPSKEEEEGSKKEAEHVFLEESRTGKEEEDHLLKEESEAGTGGPLSPSPKEKGKSPVSSPALQPIPTSGGGEVQSLSSGDSNSQALAE